MFAVELGGGAQLRPLQPWQAEEFFEHLERGREYIGEWIAWSDANPDLAAARATLQEYADKQARDAAYIFGIWLDRALVGGVMFVDFDAAAGNCEIGCWLEPAAAGRGLVTGAVRVLLDWAFGTRGMSRVEWHNATGNVRSAAVARRLGMTREGVARESYRHREVRLDMELWSLLRREWKPAA